MTAKQQRFVEEYQIDLNGSAAYQRAGYKARGHVAEANASRLLRNAEVTAAIQTEKLARSQRTAITADRVLQELARLAFVDLRTLYDANGHLKRPGELDDATAAALASVEIDELWDCSGEERVLLGHTKKVRLWNKIEALKLLGQHLRLFVERVAFDGPLVIQEVNYTNDDSHFLSSCPDAARVLPFSGR